MLQVKKYKKKLTDLCRNNIAINKMYFFGSVLSPKFNEEMSDIDILIEVTDISPEERGENLITLWDNLEVLFNRKVDLLTENSLSNPFLIKEIEQTKKLIYDRQSRKIFI
jgi:predicted nucleotidyltransferase